jgi:protocatechuate 3,4-dioxygenase beta subunit
MGGQRLVVAGTVLTTDCRPVKAALLDFWQADDAGEYDDVHDTDGARRGSFHLRARGLNAA